MLQRAADPRTEDTIVFDLLRTPRGASTPEVVGRAVFRGGRSRVDAPEAISVAVEEQLSRAFVDRIQADERPRGYRRSGRGIVDMLVPGMPEHFIARMRGLWLSYPDGSVVTARESTPEGVAHPEAAPSSFLPDLAESNPPVTDATVRRGTLAAADRSLQARPLVRAHAPFDGLRPDEELASGPVGRSDCGWLV
jgi:hypothetical protein